MKRILFLLFLLGAFCAQTFAQTRVLPDIDHTCKNCDRRYLDSLNVFNRRPIRVNQVGFRPQDYKYAYVADIPAGTKFSVIDKNSGLEEYSGVTTLIATGVEKPGYWIRGLAKANVDLYAFGDEKSLGKETLTRADFTPLSKEGEYFIVVDHDGKKDTSATFHISPLIYNAILEKALQFFGVQRCGDTKSHFHKPCHLKDGSLINKDLTGGWHDCGDHFKVSETLGYAAYVLSLTYLTYQDKSEDIYGDSYADTVFTNGIPDLLYEAKIGADFILKLYNASKADGLIETGDMYHTVGYNSSDHGYWDLPERQDAMPADKGGPPRSVLKGIGSNTSGIYIATLANVAVGYAPFDPEYSDSLLNAAKDIYKNVMLPSFFNSTADGRPGRKTDLQNSEFYPGGGPLYDDGAAAALALWYATGDTTYRYDLYKNLKIFDNENNYKNNLEYFRGGFLGNESGFYQGGWTQDYENVHAYVLFALKKLILDDPDKAENTFGLSAQERDTLDMRVMGTFNRVISDITQRDEEDANFGNDTIAYVFPEPRHANLNFVHTNISVIKPYGLLWLGFDWGVLRYNFGAAIAVFLMYDLTNDEQLLKIALNNMYYAFGANPWDMSFLVGAGEKNQMHTHNRAANPDGQNTGSMPYEYHAPIGALMGGRAPTLPLLEDYNDFTKTETCVDFSAQLLLPAQALAGKLPVDNEGPLFSNIAGTPISDTSAIISWDANEMSLVTVFYSTSVNGPDQKFVETTKPSKGGSITLNGLTPGATYYFYLGGVDTKQNISIDDNHGLWYKFTMTTEPLIISGVTICQVDHRSAKIYWWSSNRANGIVNYGKTSGVPTESKNAEGGAVLFHEAILSDLEPGTTYYFKVSSGTETSEEYSFTTESHAVYADLAIYVKPSSSQDHCTNWQDCRNLFVSISNNDTINFDDFEIRIYLSKQSNLSPIDWDPLTHNWNGSGSMVQIERGGFKYGQIQQEGEYYYLPVHIEDTLYVSGQMIFQVMMKENGGSYKDFVDGWSIIPHNSPTDPEQFNGIDLTMGPLYKGLETSITDSVDGKAVLSYVKDPYITVYYHGKHIYGYGPETTIDNAPVMNRTVTLDFEEPFKSPHFSIEKEDPVTKYQGVAKVSPTGNLDDIEKNAESIATVPIVPGRTDAVSFSIDTILAYGNNYIEWVAWHNHFANMKSENKYDCACTVIRTNVEIDTITVPPEQRYFEFTVDTINVYTGRFAEVHLILKDHIMQQMSDVDMTVTLGSENDQLRFYTSPTATLPTETIDIVKGEAVFYIKADNALQTEIYTLANSTKEVVYNPGKAFVIVDDLPPWPIISMAKMIDQDCDNVPDAMYIKLSNAYTETSSFSSIKFSYGKDTLTSDKVLSQEGTDLFVSIDVKDTSKNTNPSGSITLISKVENSTKESSDFYSDGISPTILSVSVLERLDTATTDRVYMQFSEPISAPSLEWPLQLYNGGTQITTPVTVKDVVVYNDSLNVWEFTIDFASDGSSIVKENMGAQLMLTSQIFDKSGNGVGSCSQPILNIGLKIRPIPMTYAYIADKDEDGLAEYVEVIFAQKIDERHRPDSISVEFGSAAPETLWTSAYAFSAEGNSAVLTLKSPFKLGNTNGNYTGNYQGRELVGAGLVTQHLGTGAAYETNSIEAEDKAGPVFVTATVKSTSDLDLLNISASEPLVLVDTMQTLYLRERKSEAIKSLDLNHWALVNNNASINAFFANGSDKAVMEGDRIRLAPLIGSVFADKNANQPATNNPWVTVGGDGKPKIKYNIGLGTNVVTVDPKKISPTVPGNNDMRVYIANPITHKLDLIQNGEVVASIDTNATPLQGGIWTVDLTVPRGSSVGEPPAWATLDTKYRLLVYTNLGSFVNSIEGKYQITPDIYYSSESKVTFFIEWANIDGNGIRAENGRAVGTGAYIGKIEVENRFTPNEKLDEETQKRYSSKNSYDKTKRFGIKRVK